MRHRGGCRILAGAIVLMLAGCSQALHVSPDGSDSNPGTAAEPFRTIARAAEAMAPGQTCIVHEGVYRETVRPARSGTAGKPIRFVAAEGEKVVIRGTEPVTGWSKHEGSIYKAEADRDVDQLLVDGRLMALARYPNLGDDPYKPAKLEMTADGVNVTVGKLPQVEGTWKGGTLWAMSRRRWVAGTAKIVESAPGKLTLARKVPFWGKGRGTGYVEGVLGALDAEGEWCQDGNTLYLWAPQGADPGELDVEATKRRWAFDLSGRSHVEVAGFRIVAASVNMDGADYCLVDGARFRLASFRRDIRGGFNRDGGMGIESGGLGVVLGGHDNTIRNSVVAYCVGDGISVYGENNRVENCVVHDADLSASDCAPIDLNGRGHAVTGCTVYNAGRSGILHRKLREGRIVHNHIHHVGLMTTDLGGTYCFTTDGEGTVLAWNHVHDVHCHAGNGIYIDNVSSNHLIHHNLNHDNRSTGIPLNTPSHNNRIYHNTVTRNGRAMSFWGRGGNKDMKGVVVADNILTDSVSLGEGADVHHNYRGERPGFVDPDNGDFRLRADSPCVDAGVKIEGVTGDYAGDAPDLGCFERGKKPWTAGSTLPEKTWDQTGW